MTSPDDPRVTRTRDAVFAAVRTLLDTRGATTLSYAMIAHAAGVARKTLYVHWKSLPHLLVDFLTAVHETPLPGVEDADEASRIRVFQDAIDRSFEDRATRAALTYLMAAAVTDETASAALTGLTRHRAGQLGALLGRDVDAEELGTIVGPVFFRRLVARTGRTDAE